MALKKIKEGCWVDENDPYFSLNEWFHGQREQILYYITNGQGFFELFSNTRIPEDELYEKIFIPGKLAVMSAFN